MEKSGRIKYILSGFILGGALGVGSIAVATDIAATPTNDNVFVNGIEVSAEVYKIDGSNYFKLRDIAAAVDFSVVYDGDQQRVLIDSSRRYDPDEQYGVFTTAAPYFLLADDGAAQDIYGDIAYMGSDSNGNDGSMSVSINDTSQKMIGESSMRFSYTPKSESHWAGMALLFSENAWLSDPGDKGPDLKRYTRFSFWVKGHGGKVKFFIECDGGAQDAAIVTVTDEWQKVTLNIDKSWGFCNIPFGWACNESNPDTDGGTIEFWCDGMQFE